MKKNKPQTPFPTTGYFGPEYFCNRKEETDTLIKNIKGGQSTTMTSIRRIGKTALIKHLQHEISDTWINIYVDILPTENLNQFLNYLATAIVKAVPEDTSIGRKIWNVIKLLRPVLSYDALSGEPNLTFNLDAEESKLHIENLFALLEKQQKRVLLAIDEFQQIISYPEKNCDSWLRTKIQHLHNIVFIFSGSRQHLMHDLFSNPQRPFYRSTLLLNIEKIDQEVYCNFIIEKFNEHKKFIPKELVLKILEWTNSHTYYVQLLCNRVFLNTNKKVTNEIWSDAAQKLIKEQEYVFFTYRDMLTKSQWNLLKAIAFGKEIFYPTSNDFISKFNLGSSASVLRSLGSLKSKELIYESYNAEGKLYYAVYDVLFQRWIESI